MSYNEHCNNFSHNLLNHLLYTGNKILETPGPSILIISREQIPLKCWNLSVKLYYMTSLKILILSSAEVQLSLSMPQGTQEEQKYSSTNS